MARASSGLNKSGEPGGSADGACHFITRHASAAERQVAVSVLHCWCFLRNGDVQFRYKYAAGNNTSLTTADKEIPFIYQ
jgi:hypothetical protein